LLKVALTNLSNRPANSAAAPARRRPRWRGGSTSRCRRRRTAALGDLLSYASAAPLVPGTLVRVPLGRREVLGVVWNPPVSLAGAEPDMALKPVGAALDGLTPLGEAWRDLVAFAARYYQRSIGEIALAALPPQLRDLTTTQLARRLKRKTTTGPVAQTAEAANLIALSAEQTAVLARMRPKRHLPAVRRTGSGKTEVYLQAWPSCWRATPRRRRW
jgi:primosomal protein N' (replication factor Y)